MEVFGLLLDGFGVALQPFNLMIALVACLLGTIIGMFPGIGPINGIVVLIPIAFALNLPPAAMLILFAGIYYGAEYGNAISASLLNVPGTSAAVLTALEGNKLSRMGRAGKALGTSAIASFFGGTISVIAMMFFAPLLSRWAIRFGPPQYFALIVFAFSMIASLTGKNLWKGLMATVIGLMVSVIGLDVMSGIERFTFGQLKLADGVEFVVVVIGFFAINEVLKLIYEKGDGDAILIEEIGSVYLTMKEFSSAFMSMLRGSVIGFLIGVLPGAGASIASFIAYTTERQLLQPKGETFAENEGDIRGLSAPEAANNAAVSGALIPLLTLGIPGSGTTAVMLGALLGLGLQPGPLFMSQNPDIFWGLIASMYVGNALLLVLNLPLVGVWAKLLKTPDWFLYPAIVAISFVAIYAVNNSPFDILSMGVLGIMGFLLVMLKLPLPPVILGLILGPLMERNLRRSLSISQGDWSFLWSDPISIGLWIAAIVSLCLPFIIGRKRREEIAAA